MSRSAILAFPAASASPASRRGPFGPVAAWLRSIRRARTRRQLDALDDHLRRDVGLMPRERLPRWTDPVDPRTRL